MKPLRIFLTALAAAAVVFFLPHLVGFARSIAPESSATSSKAASIPSSPGDPSNDKSDEKISTTPLAQNAPVAAGPSQSEPDKPQVFGESGPVTMEQIPPGRFRKQLLSLPEGPRLFALKRL